MLPGTRSCCYKILVGAGQLGRGAHLDHAVPEISAPIVQPFARTASGAYIIRYAPIAIGI